MLKWCHFSPSKPLFQPQRDKILSLPFSTDDLKIKVLDRRKSLSVRELVYHYLCSIVIVWLFLCFEYDFPNALNKIFLRINFSCNVQVTVIEYFSTLKMIVIKNAHAFEFMLVAGWFEKFQYLVTCWISTSSKWNIMFHYYSEIV